MTFWRWSTVAASNATADSTCPFPEGMDPAALNDGTRGMMAAAAKYRDDTAGILVTGGTSTAYTLTSNQGFDSFAHMHGAAIAFTPHATNGANGTSLNVDGLGVKPILTAPGVGLPGAVLVQGTPYVALYNNTDGAFYLHGYFNSPFNVPLLAGMDYWDIVTPNSAFIFPAGQAISRTTYAAAFARWGTTFGAGDGSTTFNVPDKRGRVSAAWDNMGIPGAGRLAVALFDAIGEQNHTLIAAEIPSITSGVSVSVSGSISGTTDSVMKPGASGFGVTSSSAFQTNLGAAGTVSGTFSGTGSGSATSNNTSGGAHNNVQPTIVCNYIIRIL